MIILIVSALYRMDQSIGIGETGDRLPYPDCPSLDSGAEGCKLCSKGGEMRS